MNAVQWRAFELRSLFMEQELSKKGKSRGVTAYVRSNGRTVKFGSVTRNAGEGLSLPYPSQLQPTPFIGRCHPLSLRFSMPVLRLVIRSNDTIMTMSRWFLTSHVAMQLAPLTFHSSCQYHLQAAATPTIKTQLATTMVRALDNKQWPSVHRTAAAVREDALCLVPH